MTAVEFIDRLAPEDARGVRRGIGEFLRFLHALWIQIDHDKIEIRASGLAYTSLVAIVPLIAVLLAVFNVMGAFERLKRSAEAFLITQFVPTRQDDLLMWIETFTDNTSRLGVIGFLFLVLTSILLLNTIESNFNDIWHVARPRRWLSRLSSYTSVFILGSLFIGASLTLSAELQARILANNLVDPGLVTIVSRYLIPFILSFLAFVVAYLLIPNAPVQVRCAALGGFVAAGFFEAGKIVFAHTVGGSVRLSTIYGSLALMPIFLIWLYATWIIVLIGLEITYTRQHFPALRSGRRVDTASAMLRLNTGLELYLEVARHHLLGQPPPTTVDLAQRYAVPFHLADAQMVRLADSGLVHRVSGSAGRASSWVPAGSPDRLRLVDVLRRAGATVPSGSTGPAVPIISRFIEGGASEFGEGTVGDFLDNDERRGESPALDPES
jgi:membrane protein